MVTNTHNIINYFYNYYIAPDSSGSIAGGFFGGFGLATGIATVVFILVFCYMKRKIDKLEETVNKYMLQIYILVLAN